MATQYIKFKRSSIPGKRPSNSQMELGELALNTYDGRIFTKKENVGVGTTITLLNVWTENVGGGAYYNDGAVGIGTTNPTKRLHILDTDCDIKIGDVTEGAPSTDGGIIFSGLGTFNSGLFTEVNGEILSYGINVAQITGIETGRVGGIFRLDTRSGFFGDGNSFVVKGRSIGTTIEHNSIVINLNDGNTFLSPSKGVVVVGTSITTGTPSQNLQVAGGAYVRDNVGIGTTNPTSKLTVSGDTLVTGVVTATTFVGALSGTATSATQLQTARTFEITGDIIASPVSFNGTGNVSLAATIQPNSVGLGTDTTGDYVRDITGTANQITVTGGTGESSTPVLSIPNQFTVPQDITVIRDLQVSRNLNVDGNITIGGTSSSLITAELKIFDSDIVLGFRTDGSGNDISNDNTANHGGIAIASTEGTPLVNLFIAGIETNPPTYKKIMWFKSGAFTGLGTDAWLINYAVGIGSTQFPTGTRLAAGNIQFTQNDLAVIRNINSSGIITASTFSGNLQNTLTLNTSGTGLSGSTTFNNSGASTFTVTSNATSDNTNSTIVSRNGSGGFVAGIVTATTFSGALSGTATSTTNIPNLSGDVSSNNTVTTLATVNSNVGTYGGTGAIPVVTVNGKGLVTGISTVAPNNGTLTLAVSGTGLSGSAAFTANQAGASTFTVTSNATSDNTNSTIVSRNGSGGFVAGIVTATSFSGTATSTTNIPNLTGAITSVNTVTSLGSFTSANLATALTDETGSGSAVFSTSPTLVTPILGSASATSINVTGIVTATTFVGNLTGNLNSSGVNTATTLSGTNLTYTNGSFSNVNTSGITTTSILNVGVGGTIITTTSNGSIGIGTTNPTSKLQVDGNATINGNLNVSIGGTFPIISTLIGEASGYNGSGIAVTQTRYGIGIGTTNPFIPFYSDSDSQITNTVTFYNTEWIAANSYNNSVTRIGADSGRSLEIGMGNTDLPKYIDFGGGNFPDLLYPDWQARILRNGTDNGTLEILNRGSGDIRISSGQTSGETGNFDIFTTGTRRLRVSSTGNIGLNVLNPTSRLHVVGDALVTGVVTATTFSGALSGTATSTTNIPNLTGDITSNNTVTTLATVNSNVGTYGGTGAIPVVTVNGKGLVTGISTVAPNNGQLTLAVSGTGLSGSSTFTANQSGNSTFTVTSNATSDNTNSTIVSRNGSGGFVAGIVTATQFSTGAPGTGINITNNTITGPTELIIDPAAVGDNTGAVRIKGNLFVDGTETFINSTTIELADFNVGIATTVGTNALLDGAGIGIGSTGIRKFITWNNSASALTSSEDWNLVTGKQYEINGTSVLSSTTLGTGVVNSSLTSVGTLASLTVTGSSTFGSNVNLNAALLLPQNPNGVGFGTTTANPQYAIRQTMGDNDGWQIFGESPSGGNTGSLVLEVNDDVDTNERIIFRNRRNYSGAVIGVTTFLEMTTSANIMQQVPLLIGTTTLTGTATQRLQVTGGAYVSGSVGVGTTNPTSRLHIIGDALVTGVVTATAFNGNINAGVGTITNLSGTNVSYSGIGTVGSLNIGSTQVISSGRQLQNIASLDATTTATIETAIANAPNTFTDLQVTGLSTFTNGPVLIGTGTSTGTALQPLQVTGGAYVSGNLGIGTTRPSGNLHIQSNSPTVTYVDANSTPDNKVWVNVANEKEFYWQALTDAGAGGGNGFGFKREGPQIQYFDGTRDGLPWFRIDNSTSRVGIGTTNPTSKLHVVGDVLVSGVITSTDYNSASDINLKENIQPIENPIDKVLQINGVSFDWKEDGRSSMGVIAQEVERVLPELVSGVDSKTVNYNGLIGLLIEVVKEQQREINTLKEKIK